MNPLLHVLLLVPLLSVHAHAQPREVVVPAGTDAEVPYAVQVLAPGARVAAVNDALSLLAVGHRKGQPAHVSLFALDAQGQPAATPVALTLPKPAAIGAHANYVLDLAFHPTLPLLYVWQDAEAPNANQWDPAYNELDHLLIYNVSSGTPQLVQAAARGEDFAYGNSGGVIAFSATGDRLYLPNLRRLVSDDKPDRTAAIGFLKLDAQGLPAKAGEALDLTLEDVSPLMGFPTALGWAPATADVVVFGGAYGPTTWDMTNRRARLGDLPMGQSPYVYHLTPHPSRPIVYLSQFAAGWLFRAEHRDGYVTGLPQRLMLAGGDALASRPVVMPSPNKLAVGARNRFFVIALSDAGRLTEKAEQMTVINPSVEALAWSEKLGKLYVPVEELPKPPEPAKGAAP